MLDDRSLIVRRQGAFNTHWKPGDPIVL